VTINSGATASRRAFLQVGAGVMLSSALPLEPARAAAAGYRLRTMPAHASLAGPQHPQTAVWAYDGKVPGPLLRARQGEPMRIVVENRLDEATTVHWHGIRLPFAMDGVPGLTQAPIAPGESFVYEFTPPDAGTFWYHPHADSLRQLGRGLAGALIVEERRAVEVDRDLLWVLADWRLRPDAQVAGGFGNRMEAAMAGRVGNTVTLNGAVSDAEPVRAGERVRLRLVNASLARIMALRFEKHRPVVVAVDGQPCDPHEPEDGRVLLGPAMRIDLMLDMQGVPGRRYRVVDDFYDRLAYRLTDLSYADRPPLHPHPFDVAPLRLPPNPLPEPDLVAAEHVELKLQGGMMGGGGHRGSHRAAWAINGHSMTGDGHAQMPPLRTLQLGRSYVLTLRNESAWWHPMHLHGHSFKLLRRNGVTVPHRQWADTVLIAPRETVDVAFVADNPGDWMVHCHVTDHQVSGMMTVLRVA